MQHELCDGLAEVRKWAKMTERYGNTTQNSKADISEIKSTLNDLASRLDRTQLRAVTPERRFVQFTEMTPRKTYSRDPSPAAPIRNYDAKTGQHLDSSPLYNVTTGERLPENGTLSRQCQDSFQDRAQQRNRSPSPSYNISGQNNTQQNYSRDYNLDVVLSKLRVSGVSVCTEMCTVTVTLYTRMFLGLWVYSGVCGGCVCA